MISQLRKYACLLHKYDIIYVYDKKNLLVLTEWSSQAPPLMMHMPMRDDDHFLSSGTAVRLPHNSH